MTDRVDTTPYRPGSSQSNATAPNGKALKYIAHGIYLQLFLGAGMLATAAIGVDTGPFFDGPGACGGLLIGLGLNSLVLVYVNRYKKSLR